LLFAEQLYLLALFRAQQRFAAPFGLALEFLQFPLRFLEFRLQGLLLIAKLGFSLGCAD
jgi:hypothetical protein